ncbi:MAG: hypothetical protein ACYCO0_03320 [Candidatus Micrarchaeaceae archaeon]
MEHESPFEEHVNSILKDLKVDFVRNGSRHCINPLRLPIGINEKDNYTPDFILNLRYGGLQILLETKGYKNLNKDTLRRLSGSRTVNYNKYYLILITEANPKDFEKLLHENNLYKYNICNEIWFEPKINKNRMKKSRNNQKKKTRLPSFIMSVPQYYPDGTKTHYTDKSSSTYEIRDKFIRKKLLDLLKHAH